MSPADVHAAAVEEFGSPRNLRIMRRPATGLARAMTVMSVTP